jgi:hypothetical protein
MSKSHSLSVPALFRATIRRAKTVMLALVLVVIGGGAMTSALGAKAGLTAPTIVSRPANPTNSTVATFTFTDSPSSVTFQCHLGTAAFTACTSPKTYPALAQATYSFQVRAISGSDQSSPSSYSWTVDATPPPGPSITAKPASLSNTAGPSFSFADTENGVSYLCKLDAAAFTACASPQWYSNIAQGAHTFSVQAKDNAGNLSGSTSWSWTIDSIAPPTPVFTLKPDNPAGGATMNFAWTDAEARVSFQCAVEKVAWQSCSSPFSYLADTSSNSGQHGFSVHASDAAGNVSVAASYQWKISASASGMPFHISGSVSGLSIGMWAPIAVTISNPNNVPVYVSALSVTVAAQSTPTGCPSAANVELSQSTISATLKVVVPANGSVLLPAQGVSAPKMRLVNLPTVNQDVCKNKAFALSYTGTATN